MPVTLLPPYTIGIARTTAEPLTTAPAFIRTQPPGRRTSMGRYLAL